MEDHVYAVMELSNDMNPSKAVGLLKGASSYNLFRIHPNFRKTYQRSSLLAGRHSYRSVSEVNEETVRSYVSEDNSRVQRRLFS